MAPLASTLREASVELLKRMVSHRARVPQESVKPYNHQREVIDRVLRLLEGDLRVVVVKIPCGGGKTEAVLAPFFSQILSCEPHVPRIIYALPAQSLLYNMLRRFDDYVTAVQSLESCWNARRLSEFKPVAEHGFDADPEYLIPRFSVATYDVVVYAWLARRTIPRRPFTSRGALLASYVVFDEAHLIQDVYLYSQRVLPSLVASMAEAGVPVVVISATLAEQFESNLKELLGDGVEVFRSDFQPRGKISVSFYRDSEETIKLGAALESVREYLLPSVKQRKDVLVVVNSVKAACLMYRELLKLFRHSGFSVNELTDLNDVKAALTGDWDVAAALLHGRLQIGERMRREGLFEEAKKLKRDGQKRASLVVVATQVAEVGIDYSFDTVITELAPPSALVQRAMRGGREKNQCSKVLVLPPLEVDNEVPSLAIYPKELLEMAKNELKKGFQNNLQKVEYLTEISSKEYEALEGWSKKESDWASELVNRSKSLIERANLLPPLATRMQTKVFKNLKFRIGEYVMLSIDEYRLDKSLSPQSFTEKLERLLESKGKSAVERSLVRVPLKIRKTGAGEHSVNIPSACVWELKGGCFIPLLVSLARVEVELVSAVRDKRGFYRSERGREIFGRIVIPDPDKLGKIDPKMGLVEVERVELRIP